MSNQALADWVESVTALTQPADVVWCNGSDEESARLSAGLTAAGAWTPLDPAKWPNCYLARSDPRDVARVEERTFICSENQDDAGPTNNWRSPAEMHSQLKELLRGGMQGRTLYVVPYLMGPPGSPLAKVGVELTDSAYVVANLRIMTRMGAPALAALGSHGEFSRGLHATLRLDPAERYICHFPAENLVISVNSNYGGNALLSKKCFALRLASVLARREGWLAEHMLILALTDPGGRKTYVAAAFPSACGKTNLSMLIPPPRMAAQGWKVETIGDDIAWLKFDSEGRLRAINPEAGFFGVAPGTSEKTNRNALATCRANSIFTNVALTPDGEPWWEGLSATPPESAIDWMGQPWRAGNGLAAHPNSRFTAPVTQCPSLAAEFSAPEGVPISAIIFGGRRSSVMPLVYQGYDWDAGTYIGATLTSERTAAAAGKVGELRFDPMAMLPFCGYHMADYWAHWLSVGDVGGARMPKVFHVNWFRKNAAGRFAWPGFGESLRVLAWIASRSRGEGQAVETPIGYLPQTEAIDTDGLELEPTALDELFRIDPDEWRAELSNRDAFLKRFGARVPERLWAQHNAIKARFGFTS